MAIEGNLAAGGGADLLSALSDQGRTGILDLTLGEISRKLVFQAGEIVYLSSDERTEKLSLRIVARGLAPKRDVVEAARAGGSLRDALAVRGLPPEKYDAELRAMIADAVQAIFPAIEGSFSFVDKPDLQLAGVLESNPMTILFWEAARACPAEQGAAFVGPTNARVQRSGDDEQLMGLPGLGPQEGFLLSRIDGYGSIDDLIQASPAGSEGVVPLVFGLCCAGFLLVTGRPGVKLPKGRSGRAGAAGKGAPAKKAAPATSPAAVAAAAAAAMEAETSVEQDPLAFAKDLHRKTAQADHYGVLGLPKDVEQGEIRKTYYSLAKLLHPDRFDRDLPQADREVVEDLFARIGEAFGVLNDQEGRKKYDEKLASGALLAQKKDEGPVDPRELAKTSYQKGQALLQMGEKERALRFLEHAVEQDGDNWDYRMGLAKGFLLESRLRRKAERHLQEAIRINETRAEAYYQLALLYQKAHLASRVLEQLELGAKWEPEHAGIQEELAALGADPKSSGLLGGLFGTKDS